jgi:biotin carboxyl carrier protein
VLEAMKMENEIKAPIQGRVKTIQVELGQTIEKQTLLVELE